MAAIAEFRLSITKALGDNWRLRWLLCHLLP